MVDLSWKVKEYLKANGKNPKNEIGCKPDSNVFLVDDGTGAIIEKWDVSGLARPTESQLNSYDAAATKEDTNTKVRITRRKAYGDIGDQLDEIFKDIDAWKVRIQGIKDSNPKS